MFYFIPGVYMPNTAASNRFLAYLKYFSERQIQTISVFFTCDIDRNELEAKPYIQVKNYWKERSLEGPFKYLSVFFQLLSFRRHLKPGDVVYCYENVNYWKLFLKKGVRVYAEYTENPDVIGLGGKFLHTSKKQFDLLCKKLSGIFVISTALKDYFMKIGVEDSHIHIINVIVDNSRFEGIERETMVESYVAYCGSVYNNKDGVDQLIKAFAITHKKHQNVKLYIVGVSPKEGAECSNMQLVKDLGVEDSVVFTGLIPAEKIPQVLKNAKVLALDRPDNIQAKYGFPTKLGEYLLTGNPTVLTTVGDIPLFLKNWESTLFAKPEDPDDFSEKMNWCLEHPQAALDIGLQGRVVALRYFNYATETQKMVEVMFN